MTQIITRIRVNKNPIINTQSIFVDNIIIVIVMRRIEAFIASEKTPYVVSALEGLGLQATLYESKEMGKGENIQ